MTIDTAITRTYTVELVLLVLYIAQTRFTDDYIIQADQRTIEKKFVFVRYVSHEIRTPLNVIWMALEIVRDDIFLGYQSTMERLRKKISLPEADFLVDERAALEILSKGMIAPCARYYISYLIFLFVYFVSPADTSTIEEIIVEVSP